MEKPAPMSHKMTTIFTIFSSLIFAQHCYGYIDMSMGSYIVQILLAGLLGLFFTLRGHAKKVKSVLFRFFKIKSNIQSK
jgi:hypothetical protein